MFCTFLSVSVSLLSLTRRCAASTSSTPGTTLGPEQAASSYSESYSETYSESSTTTSSSSSSKSTSSSPQTTWTVSVGKATNQFDPDVIQADVGDIVEFDFFPPNHSVARAEYKYPCIPYELTGRGKVGFFSGFKPVDAILSSPPKFSVRVNDSNPVFFYCSAPGSCIDWQMVGVINPNASVSLVVQKELAKDSDYMLQPGEDFPTEASASLSSMGATATPTATPISTGETTSTTASPYKSTTAAAAPASTQSGLSSGAIAGIAIGSAAILVLAGALFFWITRSRRNRHAAPFDPRQSALPTSLPPGGGGPPEMIASDGVLYVPVAKAPPDMRSSTSRTVYEGGIGPVVAMDGARSPSLRDSTLDEYGRAHRSPVESHISTQTVASEGPDRQTSGRSGRSNVHEMFAPLPDQGPIYRY